MTFRREFVGMLDPATTVDAALARFDALLPPHLERRSQLVDRDVLTARYAWHGVDVFTHATWPADLGSSQLTLQRLAALELRLTRNATAEQPYFIASFDLSTGVLNRRSLELEALSCAALVLPRPWPFDDELRALRDEAAREEVDRPAGDPVVTAVRAFLGTREATSQRKRAETMGELVAAFHAERLMWDGYDRQQAIDWWRSNKRPPAWKAVRAACTAKSTWPAVVAVLAWPPLDDDDREDLLGFLADINWPGAAEAWSVAERWGPESDAAFARVIAEADAAGDDTWAETLRELRDARRR